MTKYAPGDLVVLESNGGARSYVSIAHAWNNDAWPREWDWSFLSFDPNDLKLLTVIRRMGGTYGGMYCVMDPDLNVFYICEVDIGPALVS